MEHISKPGDLRPLIHDPRLLWSYHLEHLLKSYSSSSHALTSDDRGPIAVFHSEAEAAERFEGGRRWPGSAEGSLDGENDPEVLSLLCLAVIRGLFTHRPSVRSQEHIIMSHSISGCTEYSRLC